MKNHIIPNILFDDLYDNEKYKDLIRQYFFINIIDNSSEDGSLRDKFEDRTFFEKPKSENYFNTSLEEDKLKRIDEDYKFTTQQFKSVYIKIAIDNIPDFYMYSLKKTTREKGIFGTNGLLGFYQEENERLSEVVDILQEAEHLSKEIIDLAVSKAFDCMDLINELINETERDYEMIPFDLSKVELIHLFIKLYEAQVISNKITPSQLFLRMEKYLLYDKDKRLSKLYNIYQEYKSGRKKSDSSMTSLANKLHKIFPD